MPSTRHAGVSSGIRKRLAACSVALCAAVGSPASNAATLPLGFVERQIVSGINDAAALAFLPDGTGYVGLKGGKILILRNDALQPQPLLSLSADTAGVRGLLGLAVDPDFAANGNLYVSYCPASAAGRGLRVSRFTVKGDVADPATEAIFYDQAAPTAIQGNAGGGIAFGSDGNLYIGVGDLGQSAQAQVVSAGNGKVIRIGRNRFFPPDNPYFASGTGVAKGVWASGLRSPAVISLRPGSDVLLVLDAGTGQRQEIDRLSAGANFGWPSAEGNTADTLHFKNPLYDYGLSQGCALSGGAFPPQGTAGFPGQFQGGYFFSDRCAGSIRRLNPITGEPNDFAATLDSPGALAFSPSGVLYYLSKGEGGSIGRITYDPAHAITITSQPADTTVYTGDTAIFHVAAEGSGALSYQWLRSGVPIPGAASDTYRVAAAALADNGASFSVRIFNNQGRVFSRAAVLKVRGRGTPPSIVLEPQDQSVLLGQAISFTVAAEGSGPITYQWSRNGVAIPGAVGTVLPIPSPKVSDNGSVYSVTATNVAGQAVSRKALLTVIDPDADPSFRILVEPRDQLVMEGQNAVFSVAAQGAVGLRYQWYLNGAPVASATSSEFRLTKVAMSDSGSRVFVVVFSGKNQVQSRSAVLNVLPATWRWLGELDWTQVRNGLGPAENNLSNGGADPDDGDVLSIGDNLYWWGVGVSSPSEIRLPLWGICSGFNATIGLDGEKGSLGSVTFQVWGDSTLLFQSGLIRETTKSQNVSANLTGKSWLYLVVGDGGDNSVNDFANWAEAYLTCRADYNPLKPPAAIPVIPPAPPMEHRELLFRDGKILASPSLRGKGFTLRVFDTRGRIMFERPLDAGAMAASGLGAGLLFYEVRDRDNRLRMSGKATLIP